MKRPSSIWNNNKGFTLVELIITVTILTILVAIVSASWDTLQARIRYSAARANMDSIANAGYVDYTLSDSNSQGSNWDVLTIVPGQAPPRIMARKLLTKWPDPPCPGWFYTWDNWDGTSQSGLNSTGLESIRVSLRKANATAYFSYCVNSFANGRCAEQDPLSGSAPIEISGKVLDPHLYCSN